MSKVIDVGYVAELARLKLDQPTQQRLQSEMESILAYIEQLKELDVTGIEPTAHAAQMTNVWREDHAESSFPRKELLANAPKTINGELIAVPQVLPGEEMS
ncbi:MAG: hypothetical protein A2X49_01850 [Lentisphaerae bacterium GWF2_52_8]|nr:MAG: hypothetical protein A2X49_01850 [Lentisphaerae bacterium GWF2_52_8]